jgi:hypothetical protein
MGRKNLTMASPEYVDLVNKVAKRKSISNYVEFQVLNLKKSKKEVIKVQKANEIVELALEKEDVVVVSIYEKAFDMVDDQTKELWIENALNPVQYDMEKDKVIIGGEPTITVDLGMYHTYKDVIIQKLELAALTLQQIADAEKEKKAQEKAMKKNKKK